MGAREVKQQDFLDVTDVTLIVWLITWFIITPFSACITVDVCVTVFTGLTALRLIIGLTLVGGDGILIGGWIKTGAGTGWAISGILVDFIRTVLFA